MKRFGLTFVVVTVMGLVLAVSSPAQASTECNGTVTGMVTGGLNVGPGDICIVSDAVVVGGIHMTGGTLEACGSMIVGGVHVTGGFSVTLGAGLDDASTCEGNSISGGVKISFVVGAGPGFTSVELENNSINGAVALDNNLAVEAESNLINGSLECSGNTLGASDDGMPNTVTGQKSGQCAGL